MVKNLPATQDTWVQSLENPLEKGMATHSNILAWRIPWTNEPGELHSMGFQGVGQRCKDGPNKGQKVYRPNRSRGY